MFQKEILTILLDKTVHLASQHEASGSGISIRIDDGTFEGLLQSDYIKVLNGIMLRV